MTSREEFLLKMYEQLSNDINRHILVVWQSIGVLLSAFAVFALAEKGILPVDFGVTLMLLLVGWLFAHLADASYWYNRNNAMIANIEKQFLVPSDLRDIHYYFAKPRPQNRMIRHLRIQFWLGLGVGILMIVFHLKTRVTPNLCLVGCTVDYPQCLPYVATVIVSVVLIRLRTSFARSYDEFLKNSPGLTVAASGIQYGVGHGYGAQPKPIAGATPPAPPATQSSTATAPGKDTK